MNFVSNMGFIGMFITAVWVLFLKKIVDNALDDL